MRISELIEHLSKLDPDLPVFVDGYEGGYCEVAPDLIRSAWLFPDRCLGDDEWFYGSHLEAPAGAEVAAEALVIDRPDWRPGSLYSPTETRDSLFGRRRHATARDPS